MNIYKKSSKQREKVLLGGVAAATLGLINAKPKIVKATTLSNNKVTRNSQRKQFETKINYKTARNSTKANRVSVKQTESALRSSEPDKSNLSDQAQDADSKVDTNPEQTVDSVGNSQYKNNLDPETNRNTNSNTSTNTYQNNNKKNIKPRSNTENSSVIETTWCTVPITINTDTGVLTIKGGTTAFTYLPGLIDADDGIAAVLEGAATINHSFDADIVNKITKINIVDTVIINGEGRYMFRNLPNLTEITGLENLDTITFQRVTSLKDLFENDKNLVTIKGLEKNTNTKFDTSKLNDLTEMFKGCSSLSTLDLSGIDMSKVNNWTNMFADCSNLTTLTLGDKSKFDKTAGLTVPGTWINIESGQNNTGTKSWSSDELMSDYNGSEDSGTYTRYTGGKITVHYQDQDGKGILGLNDTVQYGNVDDKLIDNTSTNPFQFKEKLNDSNGKAYSFREAKIKDTTVDLKDVKFTADKQEVTLIYAPEEAKQVTVYYKYKDEAGNLQDIPDENGKPKTKIVSGYLGDKSVVTFDDLANYKKDSYQINGDPVTESTDNPAVTLSDQEQKVTLIYDRIPAGKVAVYYKYKDEAGDLHDILDENGEPKTKTVSGYLGDKPTITFDDLDNYKKDSYKINDDPVTESTDNPTIPLSEQEQKVTLIYTEKKTNNGSESNGSESNGSGSNGSESNGSGSNGSGSNGSESNGSGSNGSGSNGSESNGSGSNGSGSNGSGSNGSGSNGSGSNGSGSNGSGSNGSGSNGSGSNGSGSNGSGSNGSGSNDSNASNTTGSIVNSPAAIAPAVTVHYQDEYGNTVAPDRVIQGRIGDGYTTGAETVSGYTLKTRPDNATGFFINSPQSVTYVYSKNDGQTNNSTTTPAGNQTPTDNEPTPIPTSKKNKKKKAPKKAIKGLHANKQSKKVPAKSIKGLTANKHQANRPAKLAAAAHKSTSVNDPQKGKLNQDSRTDALPQTGAEKHNSLAMLALGGLALATALGAAWLERKKE